MRKGTKWRCLAILLSAAVLIGLAASCSQAKTAFQVSGHKVERAEWIQIGRASCRERVSWTV